ncbi:MAG: preprotein translocase subunit YajC [Candidatus Omnitrophota bacterium]
MFFESVAFAQGAAGGTGQTQSGFLVLFPMYVIIFLVFYFFLIRPQQKQQKEKLDMIAKVKKNDEVITVGGIHGTIVNVKEKTVVMKVDDNVKIEFDKNSISLVKKSRQS